MHAETTPQIDVTHRPWFRLCRDRVCTAICFTAVTLCGAGGVALVAGGIARLFPIIANPANSELPCVGMVGGLAAIIVGASLGAWNHRHNPPAAGPN